MLTKEKWILEEAKYKDISGGFEYTILHKAGDTEYLSGTLRSALAEWDAFKDVESMAYFMALLLSSRVLVEVNLLSAEIFPELEQSKLLQFTPGILQTPTFQYTDFNDAMAIPEVRDIDVGVGPCLSTFTAVLELREIPDLDKRIFMYVDFRGVLDWLRQHVSDIKSVAFDCISNTPLVMPLNDLLEIVDRHQAFMKNYDGPNAISELRQISLAKHCKRKSKKDGMMTSIESTLKRLIDLAQEALEIRRNTKGELDGNFLYSIFHDKKWRKVELQDKLEMLAKIYSVSRTVKLDKMVKAVADKTDLFVKGYAKNDYVPSKELESLLMITKCGTMPTRNKIVSCISKYGYYISKFNFPIYDKYAREGLTKFITNHPELSIGKYVGKCPEMKFFSQYGDLLRLLHKSGIKAEESTLIDNLDAFFWLYGIMQSIEKSQNTNTKFWWSGTCGYMGDSLDWYNNAKEFMGDR